jgi:hypothetical protein
MAPHGGSGRLKRHRKLSFILGQITFPVKRAVLCAIWVSLTFPDPIILVIADR